jgi:hypothetical protein
MAKVSLGLQVGSETRRERAGDGIGVLASARLKQPFCGNGCQIAGGFSLAVVRGNGTFDVGSPCRLLAATSIIDGRTGKIEQFATSDNVGLASRLPELEQKKVSGRRERLPHT